MTTVARDSDPGARVADRRRVSRRSVAAAALVAALAGSLLGLMARPGPARAAATARDALAAARDAGVHRLVPEDYRRAELAFLDAEQALAREAERWLPRYGRAEALYLEAAALAGEAASAAARRDPSLDRARIETAIDILRRAVGETREAVAVLSPRWGRLVADQDLASFYRQQVDAAAERVRDVEASLAAGDLPEAAARAAAAWAQVRVLRDDLAAWRLSLDRREAGRGALAPDPR